MQNTSDFLPNLQHYPREMLNGWYMFFSKHSGVTLCIGMTPALELLSDLIGWLFAFFLSFFHWKQIRWLFLSGSRYSRNKFCSCWAERTSCCCSSKHLPPKFPKYQIIAIFLKYYWECSPSVSSYGAIWPKVWMYQWMVGRPSFCLAGSSSNMIWIQNCSVCENICSYFTFVVWLIPHGDEKCPVT